MDLPVIRIYFPYNALGIVTIDTDLDMSHAVSEILGICIQVLAKKGTAPLRARETSHPFGVVAFRAAYLSSR